MLVFHLVEYLISQAQPHLEAAAAAAASKVEIGMEVA
jgi:hypothetical protein